MGIIRARHGQKVVRALKDGEVEKRTAVQGRGGRGGQCGEAYVRDYG